MFYIEMSMSLHRNKNENGEKQHRKMNHILNKAHTHIYIERVTIEFHSFKLIFN